MKGKKTGDVIKEWDEYSIRRQGYTRAIGKNFEELGGYSVSSQNYSKCSKTLHFYGVSVFIF